LRKQEAGAATSEVCRQHGISDATFYKWKAKYGGMEVLDAKRLKGLEDENRRLKKLLTEAMLDKGSARKKRLKLAARRTAVARLIERHGLSQRRACRLVGIDHSARAMLN
jgi:putative transposase